MFRALRKPFTRVSSGFTLIELIMVIVILGIVAAVLVPQLNVGTEGAKLVTAARSVVQASRYARAMALLHQAEVEVCVNPASGTVEVKARGGEGGSSLPPEIPSVEPEPSETGDEEFLSEDDLPAANTNVAAQAASAQSFADEINVKFENEGMTFEFLGYTDNVDEEALKPPETDGEGRPLPFTLVFHSNGTCRPFKVRALTEEGDHLVVAVDMFGKAKIEEYGDDD